MGNEKAGQPAPPHRSSNAGVIFVYVGAQDEREHQGGQDEGQQNEGRS